MYHSYRVHSPMCNTLPNINTTQNMAGIDIQDSSLESIGYHTVPIREGQYGHISKVEEELSELKDALEQGSVILAMIELSDLYGALEGLAETLGVSMEQVIKFSDITKRAFRNGHRQ